MTHTHIPHKVRPLILTSFLLHLLLFCPSLNCGAHLPVVRQVSSWMMLEQRGEGEEGELFQWRWEGQEGEGQWWWFLKDLGNHKWQDVVFLSIDMLERKEGRQANVHVICVSCDEDLWPQLISYTAMKSHLQMRTWQQIVCLWSVGKSYPMCT